MSGAAAQAALGLLRLLVQALLPDATVPSRHCPPRAMSAPLTTRPAGPRSLRCLGPDRPGGLLWYALTTSLVNANISIFRELRVWPVALQLTGGS
jgi:hypothetical protein